MDDPLLKLSAANKSNAFLGITIGSGGPLISSSFWLLECLKGDGDLDSLYLLFACIFSG